MLTIDLYNELARMAGSDHMWEPVARGTSRQGSVARRGLRVWLAAAQGHICPSCGNSLNGFNGAVDVAHVIGTGPMDRGYIPGNVFACHAICNVSDARTHGGSESRGKVADIPFAALARADVIPTDTFPGVTALRALGKTVDAWAHA